MACSFLGWTHQNGAFPFGCPKKPGIPLKKKRGQKLIHPDLILMPCLKDLKKKPGVLGCSLGSGPKKSKKNRRRPSLRNPGHQAQKPPKSRPVTPPSTPAVAILFSLVTSGFFSTPKQPKKGSKGDRADLEQPFLCFFWLLVSQIETPPLNPKHLNT